MQMYYIDCCIEFNIVSTYYIFYFEILCSSPLIFLIYNITKVLYVTEE